MKIFALEQSLQQQADSFTSMLDGKDDEIIKVNVYKHMI